LIPALLAWLLFLPNAPYLVTDLIHIRMAGEEFRAFDRAMLVTFAGAGLALGCLALLLVHLILRERVGSMLAWGGVLAACAASGVGVYLGRVLRLNSWDVLADPWLLPRLMAARAQDPLGNPELLVIAAGFASLFLALYAVLYWAALGTDRRVAG
jgi:uncharacterized membrane protein